MRTMNTRLLPVLCLIIMGIPKIWGQDSPGKSSGLAYVDDQGILRWKGTQREICNFGVNYTVPFAHAYRMAGTMEMDRKTVMEQDVYHLARLGLDGFRVHVWDCEISDTLGNLIENEHLDLLDYLIKLLKQRNIQMILTPIAYWGNGYPERGEDTPGFSAKYGKANCLTDPDAIRAQEVYLEQFVNHVNPYTGMAYADDPDVIAFEVCNEPHHGGTEKETRDFIDRMVDAINKTGCKKPVFYNVSHSIHLAGAYFSSQIQGGTFQWYPAGLVAGHELKGNFLPNVSHYNVPFDTVKGYAGMANIVYEYDAADIGRSYIHPYMAKAFKEAGMQFVAQFSYDPMFMAQFNTEYQTHFMNLAHAPQKALSLMIAGEAFRRLPLGLHSGDYPADTVFDVFRVSYHQDLSEMVTDEVFLYTNHTSTNPPSPSQLVRVAGYGLSPIVEYEGTGSYFLDKLEDGVWRLEVMPDAQWISDPFERASPRKDVSVILHRNRKMKISLPDLGNAFSILGINKGNSYQMQVNNGLFSIKPGTYLLHRRGVPPATDWNSRWNNIRLNEFVAPPHACPRTYLIHHPPSEITEGIAVSISAMVVSDAEPESVELYLYSGWRPTPIAMKKKSPYSWETEVPADKVTQGYLRYYLVVKDQEKALTFPPESNGLPTDWDFYERDPYTVSVVAKDHPLVLFDADEDAGDIFGNSWIFPAPSRSPGESVVLMSAPDLNQAPHSLASRFYFRDRIRERMHDLDRFRELVFKGYAVTDEPFPVELALVLDDGTTYGAQVKMVSGKETYRVLLDELELVKSINLPRTYPTFQPYYSVGHFNKTFQIHNALSVQFSVGPGIQKTDHGQPYGLAIEKVFLK